MSDDVDDNDVVADGDCDSCETVVADGDCDSCATDDSREDLPFVIGTESGTKKRSRRSQHSLTETRNGRKVASWKRIAANKSSLNWSEYLRGCRERSKRLSEDESVSGARSRPSSADPCSRSSRRSHAPPCQRTQLNYRVERSQRKSRSKCAVSRQVVDAAGSDRRREVSTRPKCPFGFTKSDQPKPNLRKYRSQKYDSCDSICSYEADTESHQSLSYRDFVGNSAAHSLAPSCSELRAEISTTLLAESSDLRRRRSPASSDRQRSGTGAKPAHSAVSTTDRPAGEYNNADVPGPVETLAHSALSTTDRLSSEHNNPDVPANTMTTLATSAVSATDRPSRECNTPDVGTNSMTTLGQSAVPTTDRPPNEFDNADLPDSSPVGSRRIPRFSVDVCPDRYDGPPVCRPPAFYSDCAECPHCLDYALCNVCSMFHAPDEHDADDCLPLASGLRRRDFLVDSDMSVPAASGRRSSSGRNARLGRMDAYTGGEFRDGQTATCSTQNMDLHAFADRNTTTAEDRRESSRTSTAQRVSSLPQRRHYASSTRNANLSSMDAFTGGEFSNEQTATSVRSMNLHAFDDQRAMTVDDCRDSLSRTSAVQRVSSSSRRRDDTAMRMTAARSGQSMDLHSSVDRNSTTADFRRDSSRMSSSRRVSSSPLRRDDCSATRTRWRSLHFYTDCADCPECCLSSFCGSCCSVHGPPEEPADLSPRCARRSTADDDRPAADADEDTRPDVWRDLTAFQPGDEHDLQGLQSADRYGTRLTCPGFPQGPPFNDENYPQATRSDDRSAIRLSDVQAVQSGDEYDLQEHRSGDENEIGLMDPAVFEEHPDHVQDHPDYIQDYQQQPQEHSSHSQSTPDTQRHSSHSQRLEDLPEGYSNHSRRHSSGYQPYEDVVTRRRTRISEAIPEESGTGIAGGEPITNGIRRSRARSSIAAKEQLKRLTSFGDVADDQCWTFVEKGMCGLLVLLILAVFFAIYLQLTHRYFTGDVKNVV